jgi:tetratricopeptide (TPR) repeat protein
MHARTLVDLGRWTEAESAYDRVLALDARYPGAHAGRGWVHHSIGRSDAAERDYTRAVELDPQDGVAWNRRGLLRHQQRRYAEALADYDRGVPLDRIDATGPSNRGAIRMVLNDLPGAEADFSDAIRMDPLFVDAWANRGAARASLGKVEASEADFARALELDPNRSRTFLQRSRVRSVRGDFEGAASDALRAAQDGKTDVSIAYALAYAGRTAEALPRFRESAGTHEYAHLWIWLLRARAGELGPASEELRQVRAARGKDDWFARVADFLVGARSEADFLKAAADREQECEATFYGGMKRFLAGDREGAKALLERCVATGLTDFVEHAGARAELQRLR